MTFEVLLRGGPMDGRTVILADGVRRLAVPALREVWTIDPDWPEYPIRFDQIVYAPRIDGALIWEPGRPR